MSGESLPIGVLEAQEARVSLTGYEDGARGGCTGRASGNEQLALGAGAEQKERTEFTLVFFC